MDVMELTEHEVPTRAALRREAVSGAREMAPIVVGLAPFGLLLGGAVGASVDTWAAWSGTLPIYGGSAQLATLGPIAHGSGLWVAVVAGVLVNLRVAVYSSSLASLWAGSRWPAKALAAATVIDPTWMVAERRAGRPGTLAERRAHYVGAAVPLTVGWLTFVTVGALGAAVGGGQAVLGVALPLCLLDLVVPHLKRRAGLAAVTVAVGVVLASRPLPPGVGILVAMTLAGVVGSWFEQRSRA